MPAIPPPESYFAEDIVCNLPPCIPTCLPAVQGPILGIAGRVATGRPYFSAQLTEALRDSLLVVDGVQLALLQIWNSVGASGLLQSAALAIRR